MRDPVGRFESANRVSRASDILKKHSDPSTLAFKILGCEKNLPCHADDVRRALCVYRRLLTLSLYGGPADAKAELRSLMNEL